MEALTLGLVEDEPQTRAVLAIRLGAVAGYRILWQADRLDRCLFALRRQPPQVLIVDLGLPEGSGLDLIAEAHRIDASIGILVLTVFGDEQKLIRAIERGARGYLLKDEPAIGLVDAIEQLRAGGAPMSPAIARHLVAHLLRGEAPPEPSEGLRRRARWRSSNSRPKATTTPRSRDRWRPESPRQTVIYRLDFVLLLRAPSRRVSTRWRCGN